MSAGRRLTPGSARALSQDNPPAAAAAAERALALDPQLADAHLLLAELDLDNTRYEEARRRIDTVLEFNPSHLEARALLGAIAYVRDDRAAFDAEVRRVLEINPASARSTGWPARWRHATTASRKPRRSRARRSRSIRRRAGPRRDRHAPDAHGRRGRGPRLARPCLPLDPVRRGHLQPPRPARQAREVRGRSRKATSSSSCTPKKRRCSRTSPCRSRRRRCGRCRERYRVQAGRADPDRDLPGARRLRRPHARAARHDRRARRLLRARRHHGLAAARPPGSFSWEATLWHEMAHVFTLQMSKQRVPRWLTEGISVYEEARARPEWGRDMQVPFAVALEQGKALKLADLNAGSTGPRPSRWPTTRRRCSSITSSGRTGKTSCTRSSARTATGGRGRGDRESDWRLDAAVAGVVRQGARRAVRDAARGAARAAGSCRRAAPNIQALRAAAMANPNSYARSSPTARRWQPKDAAAYEPLEKAAALVPMAIGDDSPHAIMARLAEKLGDRSAPCASTDAARAGSHRDRTGAPAGGPRRDGRHEESSRPWRTNASSRSIRLTHGGTRRSAGSP
jgi:tetratricopeptide (TPR) repeat protein